jgi:hypothetical protein
MSEDREEYDVGYAELGEDELDKAVTNLRKRLLSTFAERQKKRVCIYWQPWLLEDIGRSIKSIWRGIRPHVWMQPTAIEVSLCIVGIRIRRKPLGTAMVDIDTNEET